MNLDQLSAEAAGSRRTFLRALGLLGGTLLLPGARLPASSERRLRALVLGGTNFVGPAVVQALLERGHEVTLFNRGVTNPGLFPRLPKIRGDREAGRRGYRGLKKAKREWDVVIDVWPENPNFVAEAIEALRGRVGHYLFVSSVAVYRGYVDPGMGEEAPLTEADGYVEGDYSQNKVACERAIERAFPERFTIVRPGAIVGDRDPGPFGTRLLRRVSEREEILAPDANDPVQLIDAADVGSFLARCAAGRVTGHFNLVGPERRLGYKDMLTAAKEALGSPVTIHWMEPRFLLEEAGLEPFTEIPFWIPVETDPEPGFYQISNRRALAAGLEFSPLRETVARAWDSFRNRRYIPDPGSEEFFGISDEREDEVIALWKAARRSGSG